MNSSNNNDCATLMDRLEEAAENCILMLTKQDHNHTHRGELKYETEKTIDHFIMMARKMVTFFGVHCFVTSTLEPKKRLKVENVHLRRQIAKLDMYLEKYYNHVQEWKELLNGTY